MARFHGDTAYASLDTSRLTAMARSIEALPREDRRDRISLLDPAREYHAHRAELLAACERVLGRMQLLGGEERHAFETEMAAYLGTRRVCGVASGTDALWLAVRAAGLQPGDEVLLQANAFVAAAEALHRAGVTPVPVDIRLSDLGPDPDALEARLGPRTRGILVVHLHGFPVDLDPIVAIARRRGLIVIEDCSHAHGASVDGRRVGSFGAAGAFSLGVVKNLAAYGDAGLVSTDDDALADRVRLLGVHGQRVKNDHICYGTNSRLDELQAAFLRVKLRLLDARNGRRTAIARHYDGRLAPFVTVPPSDPRRVHVYHQYVIRTARRDALQAHLRAHEIDSGIHYPVPIHRQPAWLTTFGESPPLPNAERAAAEMLSLPVHPDLTDAEAERVADTVVGFFRQGVPNRRARSSRVSRVGRVAVDKRAERLAQSVAEIEVALRRAEGTIEADARERIHMLRKQANEQLAVLRGHQSEASRLLSRLATAAEGSWGDLEEAADRSLTAARTVAHSLLKRFRRAARRRITARHVPSNGG